MKSLYFRIVLTFVLIALLSSIGGMLLTSLYYDYRLNANNEANMEQAADQVKALHDGAPQEDLPTLLGGIAGLGYQLYTVGPSGDRHAYGTAFRHERFPSASQVGKVREGGAYHGMSEENRRFKLFAYFENSARNTYGFPLKTAEGTAAVFIRPDLERQIGEVRVIVAVLLVSTFGISLLLIAALSSLIVQPVKRLTRAAQRIAGGDYEVSIDTSRRDEIGELGRRFSTMARSIRDLDRMRQEFVANVSHEFQSPLTSIRGFIRTLLDSKPAPDALETRRYLAVIDEESRRLSSLSRQLLMLADVDRQERVLHRQPYRLDEQLRQALLMLEWQWTDKELQLELELPETTVAADQSLMYEVWLNLIGNAVKFTGRGGVLGIELRQEDGFWSVSVRDTGPGIAPDELSRIFERFHKADKSRRHDGEGGSGSGLGLSIVQRIVNLHGGSIEAESELGRGTVMTVRLPL